MRKVVSTVIEEMILVFFLSWIGNNYPERLTSMNTLWIMGITIGGAIVIAKAIETTVDCRLSRKEGTLQGIRRKKLVLCFCSISPVFFVAFNALEYFGKMPATNRLLVALSFSYAFCHLVISYVLDSIIAINRQALKNMFSEEYIDEDYLMMSSECEVEIDEKEESQR